ncbi:hypothetical protein FACS1894199_03120 [Bacteroidia bacterium]|nr:hypothetical protein FACS1894199_03120 [Bacteroidia bacterium]
MSKTAYTKQFLSYSAQIELLKSRGLAFDDERKTLHLLKKIGYHRLSAYWHPLLADKQSSIFKLNSNFETAFNLYKFDRELRKLISGELEKIEIAVRSEMAYLLSSIFGQFGMEKESLFSNPAIYNKTLLKIKEEVSRNDADSIVSFKSTYSNSLPPSFMLLEVTSFGTLLRIYTNLSSGRITKDISKIFGLSNSVLTSW